MTRPWKGKSRGKTANKVYRKSVDNSVREYRKRLQDRPLRPASEVEGDDYARRAANDDTYRD
jgi:hypothetical protein